MFIGLVTRQNDEIQSKSKTGNFVAMSLKEFITKFVQYDLWVTRVWSNIFNVAITWIECIL